MSWRGRAWENREHDDRGHDGATLTRRYCIRTFSGHSDWVKSVVPSDDGRLLVSASIDQVSASSGVVEQCGGMVFSEPSLRANGQTARLWDFATGETKAELRGHENAVDVAVFAPVVAYPSIRELAGLQVRGTLKPSGSGAMSHATKSSEMAFGVEMLPSRSSCRPLAIAVPTLTPRSPPPNPAPNTRAHTYAPARATSRSASGTAPLASA